MTESTEKLRWFEYSHLPYEIREVAEHIAHIAHEISDMIPDHPQLVLGLQKLIEAKDCFVRAAIAARDSKEE
jgi:hypothetical protein